MRESSVPADSEACWAVRERSRGGRGGRGALKLVEIMRYHALPVPTQLFSLLVHTWTEPVVV